MRSKNILKCFFVFVAVLVVGVTLTGCHSDDDSTTPANAGLAADSVQIIVGGTPYTYTKGLNTKTKNGYATSFTGIPCGCLLKSGTSTNIYGASSVSNEYVCMDTSVIIGFPEATTGTYNDGSVEWVKDSSQANWTSYSATGVTVIITQFDAVGGRIKGSFSGTINNQTMTGSFDVKRFTDGDINYYLL